MAHSEIAASPLAEALARVGDRWTLLVVEALLPAAPVQRPARPAPRYRGEHPVRPAQAAGTGRPAGGPAVLRAAARAAYHLTADGKELAGALRLLAYWGSGHADPAQAPRHPACGTPVEARWYCPTCDRLVDHEPEQTEIQFI